MNDTFIWIDVLVAGCGLYIIYAYYLMKVKGIVKESLMLSKDVKFEKCKDKQGYIDFVAPKLLILGICVTLCGGIGVLNDYTQVLGHGYLLVMAVFLGTVIWFSTTIKKAVNRFW